LRDGLLIIEIVGALKLAFNVVHALINAINEVYDVEEIRSFIFGRVVALVFAVGVIMLHYLKKFVSIDSTFSDLLQVLRWVFLCYLQKCRCTYYYDLILFTWYYSHG